MVRVLSITYLALAAVSAVSGLVVPRLSPPNDWETDIFEPYGQYHERYFALQCQDKRGQPFFDQFCHPMLATQKLESRPPQCIPDDCDDGSDKTTFPKPTYTPEPSSSTSSTPQPSPSTSIPKPKAGPTLVSRSSEDSNGSDVNTGGQATFFYQNGVAGACGKVHSDEDLICAIGETKVATAIQALDSPLCGKQVRITNTENGKTVTVTVADDYPIDSSMNPNSISLSEAAFRALAPLSDGSVPIEWSFV
ncbi:plant expansin [Lactarius pseudohatsudake]|nr:plant expansin [Lactarius pseudohatsudake]